MTPAEVAALVAWRVSWGGQEVITFASTRSKARYRIVCAARDAGYKPEYFLVSATRAKEYDCLMAKYGRGTWHPSYAHGLLIEHTREQAKTKHLKDRIPDETLLRWYDQLQPVGSGPLGVMRIACELIEQLAEDRRLPLPPARGVQSTTEGGK